MELDFAMLAENAEQGNSGNLHIYGGGFNRIITTSVPCTVPRISLVIRFSCTDADAEQKHTLRITITNPEGEEKEMQSIEDLSVPIAVPSEKQVFAVIVAHIGIQLQLAGKYVFTIYMDQEAIKEIPFFVDLTEDQEPESE